MRRRFLPQILLALVLLGAAQPTIATPRDRSEERPQVATWWVELGERLNDLIGFLTGAESSGVPPQADGPPMPSEGHGSLDPTSYEEPPTPHHVN